MFQPKNGHFESNLVVFSAPQGPQYLTRMAPVGSQFYLILSPESKRNKLTCLCNQRVNHVLAKKSHQFQLENDYFGVILGGVRPPRTLRLYFGWLKQAVNLAYKSTSGQEGKKRPTEWCWWLKYSKRLLERTQEERVSHSSGLLPMVPTFSSQILC